jgi:hypothetical protein
MLDQTMPGKVGRRMAADAGAPNDRGGIDQTPINHLYRENNVLFPRAESDTRGEL